MHADNFGSPFVVGTKRAPPDLKDMHADNFGSPFVVNPPRANSGVIFQLYWPV